MWQNIILFLIIFIFSNCTKQNNQDLNLIYNNSLIKDGETRFKNISQLTFSGENAEAYFSPDGKKLIFQGHDGDELCDQIYIIDIEMREIDLVSNGQGVTTCSFFQYPDANKIIYSSTFLGDSTCPSKPDYSRGYVWKLYPGYDIFSADLDGSNTIQLTASPGYDAEATFSFDGKKIIYTSLISGDLELWTMNSDGSKENN